MIWQNYKRHKLSFIKEKQGLTSDEADHHSHNRNGAC